MSIVAKMTGRSLWRGTKSELPWSATDGQLSSGESSKQLLSAVVIGTQFIYIDKKREHPRLPSQDVSNMDVDGYVFFLLVPRCKITAQCSGKHT